jgi:hypothetical protein
MQTEVVCKGMREDTELVAPLWTARVEGLPWTKCGQTSTIVPGGCLSILILSHLDPNALTEFARPRLL